MENLNEKIKKELKYLESISRLRKLNTVEKKEGSKIWINGNEYLNCASNDYLGIGCNLDLKEQFFDWCNEKMNLIETDFTSSSSRLLTGSSVVYDILESNLAELFGKEGAIVFSSGYHMNTGFFAAIFEKGDLIIADKFVHASIIDGMRLSNAVHKRFRHLDYEHLINILKKERSKYRHTVIVSESVFSMDGDIADINRLIGIANEFNAQLFIDEAHAVGCFGEKGLGVCEEIGAVKNVDFIAGTFGKALGGVGAFLICNNEIKDILINKCRSFIFTTSLPPVNISWNSFVLSKIVKMKHERDKLSELSLFFRNELLKKNIFTKGLSQIVPVIPGDDKATVQLSCEMKKAGFYVPAIKPPTVPAGFSRLRFSVTTQFTKHDLILIADTIALSLNIDL